jgi:glycosyltransferase involved in cell wall biosynthesis
MPCWNEEKSIFGICEQFAHHSEKLQNTNLKLLFVDDGSADKTLNVIDQCKSEFSSMDIDSINIGHHIGKSRSQAFGLMEILGKFEFIVLMDSDGQHRPEDAIRAINRARESGFDLIGQRTNYSRKLRSKIGMLLLTSMTKLFKIDFDNRLTEFMVLSHSTQLELMKNSQLGQLPIVAQVQKASFGYETFEAEISNRIDGTETTRWTFKQLFAKALTELMVDPKRIMQGFNRMAVISLAINLSVLVILAGNSLTNSSPVYLHMILAFSAANTIILYLSCIFISRMMAVYLKTSVD